MGQCLTCKHAVWDKTTLVSGIIADMEGKCEGTRPTVPLSYFYPNGGLVNSETGDGCDCFEQAQICYTCGWYVPRRCTAPLPEGIPVVYSPVYKQVYLFTEESKCKYWKVRE